MSGPKSSRYTLTPEQRRILAEQRRIERAKAVAKANIKRHTAVLRKLSGEMQHDIDVVGEAISRLGDDGGYYKKVGELHRVIQEAEAVAARVDNNSLSSLESAKSSPQKASKKPNE